MLKFTKVRMWEWDLVESHIRGKWVSQTLLKHRTTRAGSFTQRPHTRASHLIARYFAKQKNLALLAINQTSKVLLKKSGSKEKREWMSNLSWKSLRIETEVRKAQWPRKKWIGANPTIWGLSTAVENGVGHASPCSTIGVGIIRYSRFGLKVALKSSFNGWTRNPMMTFRNGKNF